MCVFSNVLGGFFQWFRAVSALVFRCVLGRLGTGVDHRCFFSNVLGIFFQLLLAVSALVFSAVGDGLGLVSERESKVRVRVRGRASYESDKM